MFRHAASLLLVLVALSLPALALEPVPREGGFSGFVSAGYGYMSIEHSLVAGNKAVEFDNATIESLGESPESDGLGLPSLAFNVAYTFGTSRSQISLGNALEDFLRFDTAARLSYRKQFGDADVLAVGFLFSQPATEVYADPYVVGSEREVTDRSTPGAYLSWEKILGTGLEVEISLRKQDIEDERSGATQLGLSSAQRDLLDRNGNMQKIQVAYGFYRKDGRHAFVPALKFNRDDLDGKASSGDTLELQISYAYKGKRIGVVSNVWIGSRESDEASPIFGETVDHDGMGATVQLFYGRIFGVEGLSLLGTAGLLRGDSNVDFYDTSIAMGTLGVFYRF